MNETIKLTTYRNSDLRVIYQFPKGYNLAGFLPAFFIRATPGAFPLLAINATPTPNGSSAVIVGDSVVLTLNYMDLSTLPSVDVWEGVYDSSLTKDGFVNRFAGGPVTQYIDGSYGDDQYSDNVFVEIGGQTVPVIITGGNLNAQASVLFEQLEDSVAAVLAAEANIDALIVGKANTSLNNVPSNTFGDKTFTVWPSAQDRSLRDLASRTIYPDDVKLSSQSDFYGLSKARDLFQAGQGRFIQLAPGRSGVNAYNLAGNTLNLTDCPLLEIRGNGASNYGRARSEIQWGGGAGTMILISGGGDEPQSGLRMSGIRFLGQGATIVADLNGLDDPAFDHCYFEGNGTTVVQWASIASKQFIGAHVTQLDINAFGSAKGLRWTSVPGTNNDVCLHTIHGLRIQHRNGIAFDQGASDTCHAIQVYIQRVDSGTCPNGHVVRGGVSPASGYDYAYANYFQHYNANTPTLCEDNSRPGFMNRFMLIVGTSGSEFPVFNGAASGEWSVDDGQHYIKYADGTIVYTDEHGRVRRNSAAQRLLDIYNTSAPTGSRRMGLDQDNNGLVAAVSLSDAGSFQRVVATIGPDGVGIPGPYANDAAAAAAGIGLNKIYRNSSNAIVARNV